MCVVQKTGVRNEQTVLYAQLVVRLARRPVVVLHRLFGRLPHEVVATGAFAVDVHERVVTWRSVDDLGCNKKALVHVKKKNNMVYVLCLQQQLIYSLRQKYQIRIKPIF